MSEPRDRETFIRLAEEVGPVNATWVMSTFIEPLRVRAEAAEAKVAGLAAAHEVEYRKYRAEAAKVAAVEAQRDELRHQLDDDRCPTCKRRDAALAILDAAECCGDGATAELVYDLRAALDGVGEGEDRG